MKKQLIAGGFIFFSLISVHQASQAQVGLFTQSLQANQQKVDPNPLYTMRKGEINLGCAGSWVDGCRRHKMSKV